MPPKIKALKPEDNSALPADAQKTSPTPVPEVTPVAPVVIYTIGGSIRKDN